MTSFRRQAPGFTLIELMVTVAVLTVLMVIAAPSFSDFFEKARLRGAMDDVVALLNKARAEAVKRDRNVWVGLGGTNAAWCVGANVAPDPVGGALAGAAAVCDCTDDTPPCRIGAEQVIVAAGNQYRGVTMSPTNGNIVFDRKLGTLSTLATPGAVDATSGDGRFLLRLQVEPLGHARVCIPADKPPFGGYPGC